MSKAQAQRNEEIGLRCPRLATGPLSVAIALGVLFPLVGFSNDCSLPVGRSSGSGYDRLDKKPTHMLGLSRDSGSRFPFHVSHTLSAPQIGWGVRKIGADSVWAAEVRGSGVVVAILDTGTRYTHVDLADHLWTNTDEIPDNGIDDDSNGYVDDVIGYDFINHDGDPADDNGHGTFIAGVALGDGASSR